MMYTRDYDSELHVPGGYNGVAIQPPCDEAPHEPPSEHPAPPCDNGILSILPSGIQSLFNPKKLASFKIGLEEILIIAAAAFLFFRKDGDIECAIMLLLLLFVF